MRWDEIDWAATRAPERPAPPLHGLLAAGPERRETFRHHVTERVLGHAQVAAHHAFRLVPADVASGAAARLARPLHRLRYRNAPFVRRMDATIASLRPDLAADAAARAETLARWFENTGRIYAEYSKQRSIARADRTLVTGAEHLARAEASGRPVIVTFVHTGPWELLVTTLSVDVLPGRFVVPWQPQPNRFENRIVAAMRQRHGAKALPPSASLARTLLRFLEVPGQVLLIGIDEVSEGAIKFPLFARPPPSRCNLAFAVRAAARTGGLIVPATLVRTQGARFHLAWREALEIDPGPGGIGEGIAALDAVYDPHVRAHLDQWYMLHRLRL